MFEDPVPTSANFASDLAKTFMIYSTARASDPLNDCIVLVLLLTFLKISEVEGKSQSVLLVLLDMTQDLLAVLLVLFEVY